MFELNTEALLILKTLPVGIFQFSEDVQLSFVLSHIIVLGVAPKRLIPPPFAVSFVGIATEPSSIFLSSTVSVVELIVVTDPLTVNVPPTVKSPVIESDPRVPTLVREEARTLEASVAPVKVLAAAVTVTFALPSNAVPLIFTGVVSFAAEPVVF